MTERKPEPPKFKRCHACGRMKPRAEFYRDTSNIAGLSSSCKACIRRRSLAYYHGQTPRQKRERRARATELRAIRAALNAEGEALIGESAELRRLRNVGKGLEAQGAVRVREKEGTA